jgi:hypothetical protein
MKSEIELCEECEFSERDKIRKLEAKNAEQLEAIKQKNFDILTLKDMIRAIKQKNFDILTLKDMIRAIKEDYKECNEERRNSWDEVNAWRQRWEELKDWADGEFEKATLRKMEELESGSEVKK